MVLRDATGRTTDSPTEVSSRVRDEALSVYGVVSMKLEIHRWR